MFKINLLDHFGISRHINSFLMRLTLRQVTGLWIQQYHHYVLECFRWILAASLNNQNLITEILMKKMIIFSDKLRVCNKIFQTIIKIVIIKHGSMDHYQSSSSTIFHINTQLQTQEALKFMFAILKQIGMILLKLIQQLQWLQNFNLMKLKQSVIGCSIRPLLVH